MPVSVQKKKRPDNMRGIFFYLDKETRRRLKIQAAQRNLSLAEILREAAEKKLTELERSGRKSAANDG